MEPKRLEKYRLHAAECVRSAEQITDQTNRATLMLMAAAWLRLAEQAEEYTQTLLGGESPPASPSSST